MTLIQENNFKIRYNLLLYIIGFVIILFLSLVLIYTSWLDLNKNEFRSDLSNPDGNLILHISNSSFEKPDIKIQVFLNDDKLVDHRFRNINQHQWKTFSFKVSQGIYSLIVQTENGELKSKDNFDLSDSLWIVITYNELSENKLKETFNIQYFSEPVIFL